MKITPTSIFLPFLALATGISLVLAATWGGWGSVWTAGGAFFIAIGLSAGIITLAWVAPGPLGDFLKRPVVSIVILSTVILSLCITIILGTLQWLK